ncbi:DUF3726 domain-containing protein [Shimia sp.]|uniref:DUF3726 domain-containing protein n=1 Tax=Shimia sp. TaxID=1954381 RepID=UPI003B8C95AE
MTRSLSEVEATAKKAARGAGFSWGMAEEAAKATRWLCAKGIDGCAELSRLLSIGSHEINRVASLDAGIWQSASGPLCSISLGASMVDHAHDLNADGWQVKSVVCPALLVPFAADIAAKSGQSIAVLGPDFSAVVSGEGLSFNAPMPNSSASLKVQITHKIQLPNVSFTRADPAETAWSVMQNFAHRTYAPATEASRLKGAGAGTTDND